ncbi:MAG: SDR family oxidoreductase, partial [Halobacteriales archaeon]|nr:SDR family oxidoreductase [Halobacteriales archaeon]
ALVTASSSGLGKASARALAREGANVVVNGRDADRLEEAVADIEADATGEVIGVTGDITNREDVSTLVDRTVSEFGGLDHLVTSAGGPPPLRFLDTDEADWDAAYDLLLKSVVHTVHQAADHLRADGGGSICHITSRATKQASATNVLSSSVRTSVIGLEKVLSKELAPEVRVNAVLPGSHETPRIEEMFEAAVERGEYETYEEARQARAENVPLKRIGDPMELGDTVAYLCSDRAGFITGQALVIDGGSVSVTF